MCPPSPCPASRGIISGGGQVSGASPPEDAASAHCALPGAFQAAQSTACRLLLLKGKNKSLMETKQREGPCLPFALPDLGPRALLLPQCAQLGTWRHRGENGKWVRTQGFPATPRGSALWPLRMGKKSLVGWDPAHTAGPQSSFFFFFFDFCIFSGCQPILATGQFAFKTTRLAGCVTAPLQPELRGWKPLMRHEHTAGSVAGAFLCLLL